MNTWELKLKNTIALSLGAKRWVKSQLTYPRVYRVWAHRRSQKGLPGDFPETGLKTRPPPRRPGASASSSPARRSSAHAQQGSSRTWSWDPSGWPAAPGQVEPVMAQLYGPRRYRALLALLTSLLSSQPEAAEEERGIHDLENKQTKDRTSLTVTQKTWNTFV